MEENAICIVCVTSLGVIVFEVFDPDSGPGFFFTQIARSGQLAGVCFDTVVPGGVVCCHVGRFVGQCFCMLKEKDSVPGNYKHIGAGVLSCARGSSRNVLDEFSITLSPQPKMDHSYTIFGRVYEGMEVIRKISSLAVSDSFRLISPVTILSSFVATRKVDSLSWLQQKKPIVSDLCMVGGGLQETLQIVEKAGKST